MKRLLSLSSIVLAFAGCAVGDDAASSSSALAGSAPHRTIGALTSSNGIAAISFDTQKSRITQFLEHPYKALAADKLTRNFAYDTYPGIRVGRTGTWLPEKEAKVVEYVPGTGIIHVQRELAGVTVDEYHFVPMSLPDHASMMLVKVTRNEGTGPIDAYALFNYRLGAGAPSASAEGEGATFVDSRNAIYEWGPSNVAMAYGGIGQAQHHAMSPANPYDALHAGQNLADTANAAGNDLAAGLQTSLGDIPKGSSGWAGWYTALDPGADAQAGADRVRAWIGNRKPDQVYSDEVAAWNAWTTAAPEGASKDEDAVSRQAQAVLRMGQVNEAGSAHGQILASLAPGMWNITWVRDMAYSTVGLIRSGHLLEAKAAIDFQMNAHVGAYQQAVGKPYKISVVRYFGNGDEESDSNEDGPNIEFDGFGLFLWELDEYMRASNDTTSFSSWWPTVQSQIADVLVSLQEPSGLISKDSSIWEVHQNGKERHFAYTTITAANGLCSAARLADRASDSGTADTYRKAGLAAIDGLLKRVRTPEGALIQSTEGLAAGSAYTDASVIEAVNFGLFHPKRATAKATVKHIEDKLVPPSGRGFMRSDIDAWYDSQEWVFVDLRMARAYGLQGNTKAASDLFGWNVAQVRANADLFAELHDRTTADYAGSVPMVGFGPGAYLLALFDRGKNIEPSCGAFADEPAAPDETNEDHGKQKNDPTPSPGGDQPSADGQGGKQYPAAPLTTPTEAGNKKLQAGGCSLANGSSSTTLGFLWLAIGALGLSRRRR